MRIRLLGDRLSADATRRTITGTVYRYGEIGQTSAGPLGVHPDFAPPPVGLPVTQDHDRGIVRAAVAMVDNNAERLRVAVRVVDGELGDQALADALDRGPNGRAAFSLDIEDAVVVDGLITSGRWEALGQVADPAFNSARIDQIAAASTERNIRAMLTAEQQARLAELQGCTDLNDAETAELSALQTLAGTDPAPAAAPAADTPPAAAPAAAAATGAVAASIPAVPAGVPAPVAAARTRPRGGQSFAEFVQTFTDALQTRLDGGGTSAITAALSDITSTPNSPNIEQPAWSGELWSGLLYEPIWTDLFATGDLTAVEGVGWRFTKKLAIQDYAGDKAAIPSDTITTERSTYDAARMAVGVDVDRKFYDFPNAAFVASLWEQVRESWTIKLDAKIRAYALANATAALQVDGVTPVPAQPTLLKAAAKAARALKRRKVGRATAIVVNSDDFDTLMDVTTTQVPEFLDLFGIDPRNFRDDDAVPVGTVIALAKPAATVRTLPGSPVRVDAQNIANGGVDSGFFGYWAIEEHHTNGIAKATFTPPA